MKKWLTFFELHVSDRTFYVHAIVEAEDEDGCFKVMDERRSSDETYELQPKGVIGEATPENLEKFLDIDEILPKEI